MKKRSLIALLMMTALLVSCGKVKELYAQGAYDTGDFEQNYYLEYNGIDKVNINSEVTKEISGLELSSPGYNNGTDYVNNILKNVALDDQLVNKGTKNERVLDFYEDDPKTGYGTKYGPTKCMSRINDKFSYGILSKLYDGRVHCDGYYAKSRVQLNKTGFGSFFPAEFKSGKYFAVSVRSTVNCDGFKNIEGKVNFHFSFYRHITNSTSYDKINVDVSNVVLPISNGNAHGYLLPFYFDSLALFDVDFSGIVGMSMSYEFAGFVSAEAAAADIAQYGMPTDDMTDKEKPHYAIYLYEVLFPDSTWL